VNNYGAIKVWATDTLSSGYYVISDEGADLGAEDTEHPQQACERHYEDGCDLSKAERVIR